MVRNEVTRIMIGQTNEPLKRQGRFLAFGEYLKGMRFGERVERYLPVPGSNRRFSPAVFVESLITLFMGGGRTLSDLRDLEREKALLEL